MLALALVACKGVEPAPAELDGLLHWFWTQYDEADDEALTEGFVNLDAAVGGADLERTDGTVSRLTSAEVSLVGITDRDPVLAAGVFLTYAFDCPGNVPQLEEILSFSDQDDLYPDVYLSYGRTFDTPRSDWLAGQTDRLDYDIAYTGELLGASYDADARGALRHIPATDEPKLGPFVLQRTYLEVPGKFEDGSNKSMDQDYQLEAYWAHGGRIFHAYGLWRQADFGSGFDMEDSGSQRLLLNKLFEWDDNTAALCAEGRP